MSSGIDLLGPASAAGAVTARPAETRVFGALDTWLNPCTSQSNRDGTQLQAVFLNSLLAQIRYALRASGIDLDNADDSMLWEAIRSLTPAPTLWHHGTDTSNVATGIAAGVVPAVAAYEAFVVYAIKVANDAADGGTQASFGPGLRPVVRSDGTPIRRGDWTRGRVIFLVDDGDRLMLGAPPPAPIYRGTSVGSANAIVATLTPGVSNYETGAVYVIGLAGPNTGPVVANLNGIGEREVVRSNGTALRAGDISRVAMMSYDGAKLVLLNLAQEIAPPGSAFAGGQNRFGFMGAKDQASVLEASFTARYAGVVTAFSVLNSSPANANIANYMQISVNGVTSEGATDTIPGASTSIANVNVKAGDVVTVRSTVIPAENPQFGISQYLRYQFAPG